MANCYSVRFPSRCDLGQHDTAKANVDNFVAIEASNFNAFQKVSVWQLETVQSGASKIHKFSRLSTGIEIWFGTKRSEVRILSPRFSFQLLPRLDVLALVETRGFLIYKIIYSPLQCLFEVHDLLSTALASTWRWARCSPSSCVQGSCECLS